MPPENGGSPTGFQSFADYLGLNQQSLDEIEARANAAALEKSTQAEGALGAAYQEAQRNAETGGNTSLTGTASYGDFLRLRRESQQMRSRQNMSREEFAANSFASGPELPDLRARANQLQGQVDQRRSDIGAGKANVDRWNKEQEAQRGAQDKAFETARGAALAQVGDQRTRTAYYGATQSSRENDANLQRDAANQGYGGNMRNYRGFLDQKYKNITNAGKR